MKAFMSISDFKLLDFLILIIVAGISLFLLTTSYSAYAIFPSLSLLLLLVLAHYPQIGFYLIVIFMPLSAVRRVSETDPSLTITKFIGLGLIIILIFHFIANKIKLEQLKSSFWLWYVLFLLIYLLSAMLSEYAMTSVYTIERLLVSYMFFAITLVLVGPQRLISSLPKVIIIGVTISSILGIIGTAFDISLFTRDESTYVRALGGNMDANSFSSYVVLTIPLLVHYFLMSERFQVRLFCLFLITVNIIGVMSSYSRGGLLVFTITLLLLFFEYKNKISVRKFGFVLSFILLTIPLTFLLTPESYVDRIESITDSSDMSISRRQSYIDVGFELFKENPLLGSGPGTYRDGYAASETALVYRREGYGYEDLRRYAHNTYLEVLTGVGLIGLVTFLIIIGIALKNFIYSKKILIEQGDKTAASLIGAYKVSFLSILVYFFMLSNLDQKQFWLFIAISHIAVIFAEQRNHSAVTKN